VIIKDLRLQRAGAVLPLSHSDMSSEYGTRHRAGLGITEETDAVSIVVSEERGEVSLCFRGNIAKDLEMHELRSALHGLFDEGQGRESTTMAEANAAVAISKAMAALAGEPEPKTKAPEDRPRQASRIEAVPRTMTATDSLRAATAKAAKDT
jgi:hypothetical protein